MHEKPENVQLYDTKNLSPSQKETFTDSVETGDAYEYYGDHEKAIESFKQAEQLNLKDRHCIVWLLPGTMQGNMKRLKNK